MDPHKIAERELKNSGYRFARRGGNHDIYKNDEGHMIPLKRHDFNDNDLKYILKEIEMNRRSGR